MEVRYDKEWVEGVVDEDESMIRMLRDGNPSSSSSATVYKDSNGKKLGVPLHPHHVCVRFESQGISLIFLVLNQDL